MRKLLFILAILITIVFLRRFFATNSGVVSTDSTRVATAEEVEVLAPAPALPPQPLSSLGKPPVTSPAKNISLASPRFEVKAEPRARVVVIPSPRTNNSGRLVHFELEDGLAVADGDLVLGEPVDPSITSGLGILPPSSKWPGGEVPYFVPPTMPNPERIQDAIKLFSATPIKFMPYTEQPDVLVFEEGRGSCKSYVGKVGGQQPIWISGGCGAPEIAHEIMHALGFIHEQNRSDRDLSLEVNFDNIDDGNRINFEKMPDEMMRLSGLSEFDYSSIMIYPETMFSKNGQPTMKSIRADQKIEHSEKLSEKDVLRLQRGYGNGPG